MPHMCLASFRIGVAEWAASRRTPIQTVLSDAGGSLDDCNEPCTNGVGLVVLGRLDHHAHELLRAARTHQHAAAPLERAGLARNGLRELVGGHCSVAVGDPHV